MKTTFKTKSDFLMSDSALDCVDPYFEDCMVRNIANWFNPIAYMKPEVMRKNFILLSGTSGWNIADRSIPLPIANYLLEHLSMIYMGLISNDTFRQAIKEAVSYFLSGKYFLESTLCFLMKHQISSFLIIS